MTVPRHEGASGPRPVIRDILGGSGMAPRLTRWDLRENYTYKGKGRQQRMEQQEAKLLHDIITRCDELELRWYHPADPRRDKRGWPDLAIAGPEGFTLWELKSDAGRSSLDQIAWTALLRRGPYVGHQVVRPAGWGPQTVPWLTLDQIAGR